MTAILIAGAVPLLSCSEETTDPGTSAEERCTSAICQYSYSFEADGTVWLGRADGDYEIVSERAVDGTRSLRVAVAGLGHGWIEAAFMVRPDTPYDVRIEAAYCCLSYSGDVVGPGALLIGASGEIMTQETFVRQPRNAGDDSTRVIGPDLWRFKRFSIRARSALDGRLSVGLGLLASFEGHTEILYLDRVRLTLVVLNAE